MAVGDIRRYSVVCTCGNQKAVNIYHYITTAETTGGATDQELVDAFATGSAAALKAILNNTAKFEGVTVTRIWPNPVGDRRQSQNGAGAGTVAGDPLPYQVCGSVTWQTGFGGRKNRGRSYYPFPSESQSGNTGQPDATYIANAGFWSALLRAPFVVAGAGGTTTAVLCIKNKDFPAVPIVNGHVIRPNFTTQRRRGRASGADDVSFP